MSIPQMSYSPAQSQPISPSTLRNPDTLLYSPYTTSYSTSTSIRLQEGAKTRLLQIQIGALVFLTLVFVWWDWRQDSRFLHPEWRRTSVDVCFASCTHGFGRRWM